MKQFFKLATFSVALLTLGYMAQSCTTSKIEQAQLEGYWSLKTLKGEAATEAFKGSIPSLEFDFEKSMINGSGGCNRYFGGYTLEGNVFTAANLGSTMMACMEANKEDLFLSTLATEKLLLSINNGVLTFKDNNTTVLEFNKGQTPTTTSVKESIVTSENIVGNWELTKIKGVDASEMFGENPATLIYTKDGSVNGNAGCNNYRSKATLEDGTITFGPMMSTKMACPHLEGEQTYSIILSEPVSAALVGDKLILSQNEEVVLEFIKTLE